MKVWFLIALSVVLIVSDYRYHRLDAVKSSLSVVVYPVQWLVDAPARWKESFGQYMATHRQLVTENDTLRREHFLQEARLQKLAAIEAENTQLRALLNSFPRVKETLVMAEIMAVNPDPFSYRLVLNKGTEEGAHVGQPVIDTKGVVGEVVEVTDHTSRVILLTDVNYGIPVENVRTGIRGIAAGRGLGHALELEYVTNTMDLEEGDQLVTSGLDGHYPAGYLVGDITEIRQDPGEPFATVTVLPAARVEKSRQVLLVQRLGEQKS